MRYPLFAFGLLLGLPAFAADYSGCMPARHGGEGGEFRLENAGTLKVPGAKQDKFGRWISRRENGTEVYELQANGGKPSAVVFTEPLFGDHNSQKVTTQRRFKYRGDKCYVDQAVLTYSHGSDAGKKLVTYDYAFCDDLSSLFKGSAYPDATKREISRRVKDTLEKYDQAFRKEGMEVFGYQSKMDLAESFDVGIHALQACKEVRQRYPFAYTKTSALKRAFGLNATGISIPSERHEKDESSDAR